MKDEFNLEYNEQELDSPETLEAVESAIASQISKNSFPKMNRAQRRALMKKTGKKSRTQMGLISNTAKKLSYINLIQKIRELREKENEQATEN